MHLARITTQDFLVKITTLAIQMTADHQCGSACMTGPQVGRARKSVDPQQRLRIDPSCGGNEKECSSLNAPVHLLNIIGARMASSPKKCQRSTSNPFFVSSSSYSSTTISTENSSPNDTADISLCQDFPKTLRCILSLARKDLLLYSIPYQSLCLVEVPVMPAVLRPYEGQQRGHQPWFLQYATPFNLVREVVFGTYLDEKAHYR